MSDQRIKLATFVGADHDPRTYKCSGMGAVSYDFDPRNDANDCEALIRKLGDHGFEPRINFWVSHVEMSIDHNGHPDGPKIHRYNGHNWKSGICDLAEKIYDQLCAKIPETATPLEK